MNHILTRNYYNRGSPNPSMATGDTATDARDPNETGRPAGSGSGEQEAAEADATADWETVASLPASAKLVARTLGYQGPLTGTGLADATRLPPRTVRYAVDQLESADVIDVRPALSDAREKRYRLRRD